jgi:hypothetical protein
VWLTALAGCLVLLAALPVPWLVARTPNPPGMAWRLDGRLQLDGETIDPPGVWIGLTAGRPPLVAEVVWSWLDPDIDNPRDMRDGSMFDSPALAEPAAMAVGLALAGRVVDVSTIVEARQPLVAGLPARVAVSKVNGRAIVSDDDWANSLAGLGDLNEFVSGDGDVFGFTGTTFPYEVVDLMHAPTDLEVSLTGWGKLVPIGWYRSWHLATPTDCSSVLPPIHRPLVRISPVAVSLAEPVSSERTGLLGRSVVWRPRPGRHTEPAPM